MGRDSNQGGVTVTVEWQILLGLGMRDLCVQTQACPMVEQGCEATVLVTVIGSCD